MSLDAPTEQFRTVAVTQRVAAVNDRTFQPDCIHMWTHVSTPAGIFAVPWLLIGEERPPAAPASSAVTTDSAEGHGPGRPRLRLLSEPA